MRRVHGLEEGDIVVIVLVAEDADTAIFRERNALAIEKIQNLNK